MEHNLGYYFSDISRLIRRRFDAMARANGVTGAQWRVLAWVAKHPGINQGQIAEALEVEAITVCRMIDRMEHAGLVERRLDPNDRRARQIYPAGDVGRLTGEMARHLERLIDSATHGLTDDDRTRLTEVLDHIRRNLLDDALFSPLEIA